MAKQIIHTDDAPAAVGTYSQAVKVGQTVYISGQNNCYAKLSLVGFY